MTGTTGDIIPIVIIPVVALAFCLVMIYHADSHPRWGSQAPADTASTHALEGSVPAQRLSSPGPVVPGQRPGTAPDEVTPEQARAGLSAVRPLRTVGFLRRLSPHGLNLTRAKATRPAGLRKYSRWILFRRARRSAGAGRQGREPRHWPA